MYKEVASSHTLNYDKNSANDEQCDHKTIVGKTYQ